MLQSTIVIQESYRHTIATSSLRGTMREYITAYRSSFLQCGFVCAHSGYILTSPGSAACSPDCSSGSPGKLDVELQG